MLAFKFNPRKIDQVRLNQRYFKDTKNARTYLGTRMSKTLLMI